MEALANLARQNNAPASQPAAPAAFPAVAQAPAYPPAQQPAAPFAGNLSSLLSSLAANNSTTPPQPQQPAYQPPQVAPAPGMPYSYPPYSAAPVQAPPPAPAPAAQPGTLNPDMQQQVMLIKALADQGVPFDKIPGLIQTMQAAGALPAGGPPPVQPHAQQPYGAPQQPYGAPQGYDHSHRSPNRYNQNQRSRSRSPGRRWDGRDSGNGDRRDSYETRTQDDVRGQYRQRSPAGGRRAHGGDPMNPPAHRGQDKWVEIDRSLPENHIRVFSRTLFVGGVT